MAKGFKDSSGKFRPTGNNGKSSRKKSTVPDPIVLFAGKTGASLEDVDLNAKMEFGKGFDEDNYKEVPVGFNVKVVDDSSGSPKRLTNFRLRSELLNETDLENVIMDAMAKVKDLELVPNESDAVLDDIGFEGFTLDVQFIGSAVRLILEPEFDPDGDFGEEFGDQEGYDEGEAENVMHEELQDQFVDKLQGERISG